MLFEMEHVQDLIIKVAIIAIIVIIAARTLTAEQLQTGLKEVQGRAYNISVTYIPGGGKITNPIFPAGDLDTDAVSINEPTLTPDGYLYRLSILPSLKIDGEGTQDIIAVVTFKGVSARAKNIAQGGRDYYSVEGGTTDEPNLEADVISTIPPIVDYSQSSPQLCDRQTVIVKNGEYPLQVTTFVQARLNQFGIFNINELPGPVKNYYSCKAKFDFFCDREPKGTEFMAGCDSKDPLDCEENIEICGGVAHVQLIDKPDCDTGKVQALIKYDGTRRFKVSEDVALTFWKKTYCTMETHGVNALFTKCPDDYISAAYLKAGIIMFGGVACA